MPNRTIKVDGRYLIMPVEWGETTGWLSIRQGTTVLRELDIRLSQGTSDYEVFLDLDDFQGSELTFEHTGTADISLSGLRFTDQPVDPIELYQEPLRSQFHFSSRRGWNNDPNGLFYYDGEYHLFYQHNPAGSDWGNMHWGSAVSTDLVHWQERPIALYPDKLGAMWSGSAVVDHHNTAGLQTGKDPAVVAIYTAAGGHSPMSEGEPFTQCLAYSNDRGRTWDKYDGNPVLGHHVGGNRDPKIIWHPETERWIMPLYMAKNDYAIFGSQNLLEWEHLSDLKLPRTTECPDLFPLPVDGDENDIRWVFWAANTSYYVGSFDGRTFVPEQEIKMLQPESPRFAGGSAYAAQTWSDIPAEDGRRIQISWMRQSTPGMPFGQLMTIPQTLQLTNKDNGISLSAAPVVELEKLRQETWQSEGIELGPGSKVEAGLGGELLDIEVEIELGNASAVGIVARGIPVWYDKRLGTLLIGKYMAQMPPRDSINLRILVDRVSLEVYADGGAIAVAAGVVLRPDDHGVYMFASGGSALVNNVKVSRLRSAWQVGD